MVRMKTAIGLGLAILLAAPQSATLAAPPAKPGLKLERVVMLMRHSVRPPTSATPTPPGYAAQPWSRWSTGFGELTPHGAEGARLMGVYDRAYFASRGLVPAKGCPGPGDIAAFASGKSRAIDTAKSFAEGMFPGCGVPVTHPADENNDPIFHPLSTADGVIDGNRALAAAQARLPKGGMAEVVASHAAELATLQRVLGCCAPPACVEPACRMADIPTTIRANPADGPDLTGVLGVASTASQTVLLEYLEGKPMSEVGWGRASKAEIRQMLRFHTTKYLFEARAPYVAERVAAPIARKILDAVAGAPGTGKLTVMAGHDTNIAMLGGMLDLHWTPADYPRDDPPPGGALGFEVLRNAKGARFVRAFYQAQSMDQLRNLTPLTLSHPPAYNYLPITGCTTRAQQACPLATFQKIVQAKLDHPAP